MEEWEKDGQERVEEILQKRDEWVYKGKILDKIFQAGTWLKSGQSNFNWGL